VYLQEGIAKQRLWYTQNFARQTTTIGGMRVARVSGLVFFVVAGMVEAHRQSQLRLL
jgi:hypothetical protein